MRRAIVIRSNFDTDVNDAIKQFNKEIDELAAQFDVRDTDIQKALDEAAIEMRDAIRHNTPEADRILTRRLKGGDIAARYHPGNLKRSIQIFSHLRDKVNKYVGPYVKPRAMDKSGEFKGENVDGWYAHIVEYNTGFMRSAVFQNTDAIQHRLFMKLSRIVNKKIQG